MYNCITHDVHFPWLFAYNWSTEGLFNINGEVFNTADPGAQPRLLSHVWNQRDKQKYKG